MTEPRATSFALRLCPSLREDALQLAREQGVSLNHFISMALTEKLARLEARAAANKHSEEQTLLRNGT